MQSILADLYSELYANSANGKMDNLTDMANRLSRLVGKEPGWSAKYIRSVMAGNYAASEQLQRAINALAATMDGQSPLIALIKPIQAYSINGVEDGSIVLGHSKRCLNCGVLFVGVVYNQIYCCKECRKEFYAIRS